MKVKKIDGGKKDTEATSVSETTNLTSLLSRITYITNLGFTDRPDKESMINNFLSNGPGMSKEEDSKLEHSEDGGDSDNHQDDQKKKKKKKKKNRHNKNKNKNKAEGAE